MSDAMERFALAQAVYSQLGAELKTNSSGNIRGDVDGAVFEMWSQTGSTSYPLTIGGEVVGSMNVTTSTGYDVVDRAGFTEWATENGYLEEVAEINRDFDWRQYAMEHPTEYWELWSRMREVPGLITSRTEQVGDWREHVTHDGRTVFNADTGELLPWAEWRTVYTGTKVSGCKWEGGPKKYVAVKDTAYVRNRFGRTPIFGLLSDNDENQR